MALSFWGGAGSLISLSWISPIVSFEEGTSFVTVTPDWEDDVSLPIRAGAPCCTSPFVATRREPQAEIPTARKVNRIASGCM
jgi:hypothetical protein